MPLFSERFGYGLKREALQLTDMDMALRNSLWNVVGEFSPVSLTAFANVVQSKLDKTAVSYRTMVRSSEQPEIEAWFIERFQKAEWYKVFDILETYVDFICPDQANPDRNAFIELINQVLENEGSGYRVIAGRFVPITNEWELVAIDEAIEESAKAGFAAAWAHIQNALKNLGERPTGNYPNAVTEAILAVESACKVLADDENGTLGSALKKLEGKVTLHPAFKAALGNLYGYASDTVRHGQTVPVVVDFATAKFMVVTCSAILNFLLDSARAQGLLDQPRR